MRLPSMGDMFGSLGNSIGGIKGAWGAGGFGRPGFFQSGNLQAIGALLDRPTIRRSVAGGAYKGALYGAGISAGMQMLNNVRYGDNPFYGLPGAAIRGGMMGGAGGALLGFGSVYSRLTGTLGQAQAARAAAARKATTGKRASRPRKPRATP